MKIKYLCALLLAALIYSCDDSTTGIGEGLMPGGDKIPANADSYEFTTRSLLADSIYARTSTAYLGRYTDKEFGEFSADFLAQFTCPDNFEFNEEITEITDVNLLLTYTSYFGDSLSAMRMQIDTLNRIIPEKELSTFYTSVDPKQYYNPSAKPVAVKAYSALGPSTVQTPIEGSTGVTQYMQYTQQVKLPLSLGTYMFDKYKENKNYYKDAENFIQHILKGVYVHTTHGDGSVLYISDLQLVLRAKRLTLNSAGVRDSVLYRDYSFAATKEVIQANHFYNADTQLKELAEDNSCTYLKSPAGIYTEATFPITDIYEEHKNDTLNGINVTFSRYNNKSNTKYEMPPSTWLLMVRKQDMYTFFEENRLTDGKTAFTCKYSAAGNSYTFSNIAPLITYCIEERKKGLAQDPQWESKNPDWNKVVLIPVTIDSTGDETQGTFQITGISNNLSMESSKLKGGEKDKLKMQIYYTRF